MNNAVKDATNQVENMTKEAGAQVEAFQKDAQKAMSDAMEKASKAFEDMQAFSQANVDAMVKSSEISAKAAESMTKEFVDFSKKSFDDSVKATQDIAGTKTASEMLEKQVSYGKTAFDAYVAQTRKFADMASKTAQDAFAPLNDRVKAANELTKSFTV